eukprot:COSAG01_NODE_446_length_16939_cov_19.753518_13_plen_89_part_00
MGSRTRFGQAVPIVSAERKTEMVAAVVGLVFQGAVRPSHTQPPASTTFSSTHRTLSAGGDLGYGTHVGGHEWRQRQLRACSACSSSDS